jgi:hypothetical protein
MSEPELEGELASRGVRVTRRFERSRLEEELYEAAYEALLTELSAPIASDAGWSRLGAESIDEAVEESPKACRPTMLVEAVPA